MKQRIKTKKYSQFTLYDKYHRKTTKKYLSKLERQILADNNLINNPIEVTEKMEIVDGRHRYLIAKKHNLELYYKVNYKSKDYWEWITKNYE